MLQVAVRDLREYKGPLAFTTHVCPSSYIMSQNDYILNTSMDKKIYVTKTKYMTKQTFSEICTDLK